MCGGFTRRYAPRMGIRRNATGLAFIIMTTTAALTACAAPASSGTVPASPTTSAPPAESSTVAQWASLIARQQADWEDWSDDWDQNRCNAIYASSEAGVLCRLQLTSAMYMSQTTAIEYQLATTSGKKGFIAASPPAEISGLFTETREAAQAAKQSAEAWDSAGCSLQVSDECGGLTITFERAIDDLTDTLVGWTPYM